MARLQQAQQAQNPGRRRVIGHLLTGVAIHEGSLATAPRAAFGDVDAVFLFPADDGVEMFVDRAAAAGIRRFVVLSSPAVSGRNARDASSVTAAHHRAVDDAVRARTDHGVAHKMISQAHELWNRRAAPPSNAPA